MSKWRRGMRSFGERFLISKYRCESTAAPQQPPSQRQQLTQHAAVGPSRPPTKKRTAPFSST